MENKSMAMFTLADVKRAIGIDDGLNDDFLIYNFDRVPLERQVGYLNRGLGRVETMGVAVLYEGEARININTRSFTLRKGMALIILPMNIYRIEASDNARGFVFAVSSSLLDELNFTARSVIPIGLQMFNNPCFSISGDDGRIMGKYIDLIYAMLKANDNYNRNAMRGMLSSLFFFMNEVIEKYLADKVSHSTSCDNRNSRLLSEFVRLLTENFRTEHRIAFYADKLCLTPKYLSSLIKQSSGKSVSTWIDDILISESKLLLTYSDLSVQQIAYQLNFPTASFFGTYFKRHTGMTPGDFREGRQR